MRLQYLDGKRLQRAINAGWLGLNRYRDRLNAINVFPVADGDTGTNMALTLRSAVIGANSAKTNDLFDVANSIALHSLRGAQGNSGVILSQYFKGIAEYIQRRNRLYPPDIAGAFSAGAESAYKAVRDPKEGTILTVLREIAEHLQQMKPRLESLSHLMESAIERGRLSLENTRHRLKVLSDANVVDAGGEGFIHFIEGINTFIKTGELPRDTQMLPVDGDLPKVLQEVSKFRFCTEFLVNGESFDTDSIRNSLQNLGDSLIVASTCFGNERYLRIHIHTDTPDKVEIVARSAGMIEKRKIEDMQAQNISMRGRKFNIKRTEKKTVRIVTDSTCDLPAELAEFYDIEIVPLKVNFGDELYLDGVDLDNQAFYEKLQSSPVMPKTSQPSPADFTTCYREVFDRGDCQQIISIHLSSKLSGTFNSSTTAAREFEKNIIGFDSGTVSLGLGLMVLRAAEMAKEGYSANEILERLAKFKKSHHIYFTLGSLDYLIKGGRVGKAKGFVGKLLGLKPILEIKNGEIAPVAKERNEERIIEKIISLLPKPTQDTHWAVAHAMAPEKAGKIIQILKERFNAVDILSGEFGPTVGAHAGPGTWGIISMRG